MLLDRFITRLSTVSMLGVVIATVELLWPAPVSGLTKAETGCQKTLTIESSKYVRRVLKTRQKCLQRIMKGEAPRMTDCVFGVGDLAAKDELTAADSRLSRMVERRCASVSLDNLGFPGRCSAEGGTFSVTSLEQCVRSSITGEIRDLLRVEYPAAHGRVGKPELGCISAVGRHSAKMVVRELRSRQRCLAEQSLAQIPDSLNCRAQILPWGPGTGSSPLNSEIARAYADLLIGIARRCSKVHVADVGFSDNCPSREGEPFDLVALRSCQLTEHRARISDLLDVSFPRPAECGNGIIESLETCDDGNRSDNDTCTNSCRIATCGDGSLCSDSTCVTGPAQGAELCDDGAQNADGVADSCRGNCALPICGDGVIDAGEQCDPPRNGCDYSCRIEGVCGDGQVGFNEQCDDGNHTNGDGCDDDVLRGGDCSSTRCGNGVVAGPELCDDAGESSVCDADCTPVECGDAVVNRSADEQCDDGNTSDTDSCLSGCILAICGDGIQCSHGGCNTGPGSGPEECDDGNTNGEDLCTSTCSVATCGDGVVCRDAACTSGPTSGVEDCDRGSDNSDVHADACRSNCASAFCGDGVVDAGEECDAGGVTETGPTGCRPDCSLPVVCSVTLGVSTRATIGALQYEVDYGVAPGEFVGVADAVSCQSLVSGGFATFRDEDQLRLLRETVIVLNGFVAPADIASCSFLAGASTPTPEDFAVNVINASDPDFAPLDVALSVTSIDCAATTFIVDSLDSACPARPLGACLRPTKNKLKVTGASAIGDSNVRWVWRGAADVSPDTLGDPLTQTDYQVCAYALSAGTSYPLISLELAPSLGWSATRAGGWSFDLDSATPGWLRHIRVDAISDRRARVRVGLRVENDLGAVLRDASEEIGTGGLVLQLTNDEGLCWSSEFKQ